MDVVLMHLRNVPLKAITRTYQKDLSGNVYSFFPLASFYLFIKQSWIFQGGKSRLSSWTDMGGLFSQLSSKSYIPAKKRITLIKSRYTLQRTVLQNYLSSAPYEMTTHQKVLAYNLKWLITEWNVQSITGIKRKGTQIGDKNVKIS